MGSKSISAAIFAAVSLFAVAAPAHAAITPFGDYSQLAGNKANVYFKNDGTNGSNGTGGSLYTIATNNSTTPGTRNVSFSFLQPAIAPFVTNAIAAFTLNASVAATPAQTSGSFLIQPGIAGSFSFVTTSAITIGATTYAIGSNLLSATFSQAAIFGQRLGTSGSFSASSTDPLDTISYTSDFLTFDPASSLDFSMSLTSITSVLQAAGPSSGPNRALRSFRALSTGSFSSDPEPMSMVPEPATWGLMIVGFGMVGLQSRRRARNAAIAA